MTADPIRITVPGAIVPWQRARRLRLPNGADRSFTKREVEAYHAVVRMAAERAMEGRPPLDGPIELSILAVFAAPASWSGKRRREALAGIIAKTSRPDLENSVKGAQDAMQSIVYRDDSQIVSYGACSKIYGDRPRLEIVVTPIAPATRQVQLGKPIAAQPDLFAGAA